MASMFWGLKLEPGKRYSTTVEKTFHVSKAVLDHNSKADSDEYVSVMLEEGYSSYMLCSLNKSKVIQTDLDLNFITGERITLYCTGKGTIYLTGYMVLDDDEDHPSILDDAEEGEEADEDLESQEILKSLQSKDKNKMKRSPPEPLVGKDKKKKLVTPEKLEESSDDSLMSDDEDIDEEEDEEDDSSEEDSDEEMPEEVSKEVSKKNNKNNAKLNGSLNEAEKKNDSPGTPDSIKKGKKSAATQPQLSSEKGKKVLSGGVISKDVKVGSGPVAQPGRKAVVYYVGRLKSNNKVFDSCQRGTGFKFSIGSGDVIKAWDIGVVGMKVGGKRILTCPPQVAYGQKGAPPTIPPNSTLVFEIELKGVQ